jgi:hypothetical protein
MGLEVFPLAIGDLSPISPSDSTPEDRSEPVAANPLVSKESEEDLVRSFGKSFPLPANNFDLRDCLKLSERPSVGLINDASPSTFNSSEISTFTRNTNDKA